MCLGIPGQIVELVAGQPDVALVDIIGVRRPINVGLLEDGPLRAGDWVLIHVGFALARMDEAEAQDAMTFLKEMAQAADGA
jgi:hydrogenase expression/formation protein HypC